MVPNYLFQLLPPERHENVPYVLRNIHTVEPPFARLETFKRSFIPYATRLWNALPTPIKNIDTIGKFKELICFKEKNDLYYYGKRWSNIHHSRMRIGCSGLNYDLHYNLHVTNTPSCTCGNGDETAFHYLMNCCKYVHQREIMQTAVNKVTAFDFNTLLYGKRELGYKNNCLVFDAVHKFITDTKRFA